ncbi:hypothetical protein HK104_007847, partial [Borealophlyctis nickersoniae]
MKRARQTAEIVAQNHPNAKFLEIEDLAEISWGDWDGHRVPALNSLLKSWANGDFEAKSPNGESPVEVERRAVPALYDILQRPEQTFLIVVHGRLLRILLSSIVYRSLDHMQKFTHHNTCVNVVDAIIETDASKLNVDENREEQNQLAERLLQEAEQRGNRRADDNVVDADEEGG